MLHPPKYISSFKGLGVNTTKTMRRMSDTISIGTETWNAMNEPWREGEIIIAKPGYTWVTKWEVGAPYVITKFYDHEENLIGIYCDISRPVKKIEDGFSFVDLYLDVWQPVDEKPMILDEDELNEAVKLEYISHDEAESARKTATALVNVLMSGPKEFNF